MIDQATDPDTIAQATSLPETTPIDKEAEAAKPADDYEFIPMGDRVWIQPIGEDEKTKGGIILPQTAVQHKSQRGKVVAIGPGFRDDTGKFHRTNVLEGDVVIYGKYSGTEVKMDEQTFVVLREGEIYATIRNKTAYARLLAEKEQNRDPNQIEDQPPTPPTQYQPQSQEAGENV